MTTLHPKHDFFLLAFNALMLLGAWMLAIWLRFFVPLGHPLTEAYQEWPWQVWPLWGLAWLLSMGIYGRLGAQYGGLLAGSLMMGGGIALLLPEVSQLQLVYFVVSSVVIGYVMVVMPGNLRRKAYMQIDLWDNLVELYQKRGLLFVWLKYRIEDRYSQTLLGILWIVLLPLSTSAVLAFAFSQLLGAGRIGGDIPMVSFILSGIAIFSIFRDMVLKAKESLLGATSIISRVYFPREIIIILVLGETFIDFLFVFAALIVINMTQGIFPNVYYSLLPLPILIMTLFSSGLAFLLAWLGLIIRDLQQLLTVLVQLLFYIVVFYAPERVVSDDYAVIINFIPLAPLVTAFRDILLYERMPDLISLYYPLVLGCMLLYFGYVYFKVNEDRFMDFI